MNLNASVWEKPPWTMNSLQLHHSWSRANCLKAGKHTVKYLPPLSSIVTHPGTPLSLSVSAPLERKKKVYFRFFSSCCQITCVPSNQLHPDKTRKQRDGTRSESSFQGKDQESQSKNQQRECERQWDFTQSTDLHPL